MKEIVLYEASDGKRYKTRQGCKRHEARIAVPSDSERLEVANGIVMASRSELIGFLREFPDRLKMYRNARDAAAKALKVRRVLGDGQRLCSLIRALEDYRKARIDYLQAMRDVANARAALRGAVSRRDELLPLTSRKRRKEKNGNQR